jgi:putative acetyltransferase
VNLTIRRALDRDAPGIIHVHNTSIRELCSKDYSAAQIEAWVERSLHPEVWVQRMERDYIWVIEEKNRILGFGHLALMDNTNAEVMGLYLIAPALGKGLAKELVRNMIRVMKEHELTRLSLLSTITAKTFYESLGFIQYASDTSVEMRGVAIPCLPMECELTT